MFSTLPTGTAFLSQLLQSLTSSTPEKSNSAQSLPTSTRPILLALHVLFPHLLLDALDLLDRGLVTRLLIKEEPSTTSEIPSEPNTSSPQLDEPAKDRVEYIVASNAQPTSSFTSGSRHFDAATHVEAEGAARHSYLVSLTAWSCTCAAFTFAAYAPTNAGGYHEDLLHTDATFTSSDHDRGIAQKEQSFAHSPLKGASSRPAHPRYDQAATHVQQYAVFGGLSKPIGISSEAQPDSAMTPSKQATPPACKHILACAVADAWPAIFIRDNDDTSNDRAGKRNMKSSRGSESGSLGARQRIVSTVEAVGILASV